MLGSLSGILGWVYVMILCDDDMVFGFMNRLRLPKWVAKVLRDCEYCVAGQIALWFYIALSWGDYNVIEHLLTIGVSIFTVEVINGIKANWSK